MNRIDLLNGSAALLAMAGSLAGAHVGGEASGQPRGSSGASTGALARYQRIASASTVADPLLRDLCPADSVIAVSTLTQQGPQGHRYSGLTPIPSLEALEQIIALSPEVLVVSNVGDARRVARLREAGIEVVDLGPPTGWGSLRQDIERIGELCGRPEPARMMADTIEARLERVAPPEGDRPSAVYVSVYGGRYYGGTTGSSYHDVLRYAGLTDAAAEAYTGFPQYSSEQLLAMNPAFVVTKAGMEVSLCDDEVVGRMRACLEGHVLGIEGTLLDDPGLGMLDAAERVSAAVFGQLTDPGP